MDEEPVEVKALSGKPLKIVDAKREIRKGVVASSLQDIIVRARAKLGIDSSSRLKIVLEQDGTEVDDDEYFSTMETNTSLMILVDDERWWPVGKLPSCKIIPMGDQTDGGGMPLGELEGLVDQLHGNLTHISMMSGKELELLTDMDPDSLADIIPDSKVFLQQVKEASGRFLGEKRQAQDALELLKMYPMPQQDGQKREKL